MNILARLFGVKSKITAKPVEHAVIVTFMYGGSTDLEPLFALERQLESSIAAARVGEYDGNEIAVDGSDRTLYMYGPDADKLFAAARPTLEASSFMKGALRSFAMVRLPKVPASRQCGLRPNTSLERTRWR